MIALLRRFLAWVRGLLGWTVDLVAPPEQCCPDCGEPLAPGSEACPRCPRPGLRGVDVDRRPLVLRPLSQGGDEGEAVLGSQRPRLALDLGTSASAVGFKARAQKDSPVELVDFGPLGEGDSLDGPAPRRSFLVGSEIFEPDDGGSGICLGRTAVRENRDLPGSGRFYTSVKRALEAHAPGEVGIGQAARDGLRGFDVQALVRSVFLELLLLALLPEQSTTWIRAEGRRSREPGAEGGRGADGVPMPGERATSLHGIGFPTRLRAAIVERIRQHGVDLFITVPNSFARSEIDALKEGARAAAESLLERMGVPGDRQITVRTLREAEAIAWWERFAWRDEGEETIEPGAQPPPSARSQRWLVFDMGAGTTDLALLEIRGGEVRLIRRSGVPLGGDDVDLLLLLYLAHRDLRAAGVAQVLDGVDASLRDLAITLPGLEPAEALVRLADVDPAVRQQIKREARSFKDRWSGVVGQRMDGQWAAWLKATVDLVDEEGWRVADLTDDRLLLAPLWSDRYRLFVHLVTVGCCRPLVEAFGALTSRVDRVVISGRSAYLPGIEPALREALRQSGLFGDGTRWGWVSEPPEQRSSRWLDSKLAVVRGAAVFSTASQGRTAPARLADQIVAEIQLSLAEHPESVAVIPQNTQLDGRGQCRRLYRIRDRRQATVPISIYRQRIPEAVVADVHRKLGRRLGLSVGNTRLCRRPLADLGLEMRGDTEYWLGFQVDEQNGRVDLFGNSEGRELRRHDCSPGWPSDPTNPITGLDGDWLWGGEQR